MVEDEKRITFLGEGSPRVCICSIIHGNEKCGLEAVNSLKNISPLGTLILVKANLEASKSNERFLEVNLNRVFPGKEEGLMEERIAFQIYETISNCDYFLDLHSASEETPPFVIVSKDEKKHEEIASLLGVSHYVVIGDIIKGSTLDGNGLRFAVECGQHESLEAKKNALMVSKNFLIATGLIKGKVNRMKLAKYKVIGKIDIDKDKDFIPSKSIKSFKLINKGDLIGEYPDKKLFAEKDFIPILVDKKMREELLFMVERIN